MANELRLFQNFLGGRLSSDLPAASTVVTDGVTTNASTTVTSATAAFTAADVGAPISGTNIPANSYIVSVTNGTTVVISAAATASGTGISLTIGRHQVMQSPALAAMGAVGTTQHMMVALEPDGLNGEPEIVMVTKHDTAATWAQITRAQRGTTARAMKAGYDWVHTPVDDDYSSPAYVDYAPTISQNGARTTSVLVARYKQTGKKVHYWGKATLSNAGTAGNSILVGLPVNAHASATIWFPVGVGHVEDSGTIWMPALVVINSASDIAFVKTNADSQSFIGANPSFALASGDTLSWNVTYEAA